MEKIHSETTDEEIEKIKNFRLRKKNLKAVE